MILYSEVPFRKNWDLEVKVFWSLPPPPIFYFYFSTEERKMDRSSYLTSLTWSLNMYCHFFERNQNLFWLKYFYVFVQLVHILNNKTVLF